MSALLRTRFTIIAGPSTRELSGSHKSNKQKPQSSWVTFTLESPPGSSAPKIIYIAIDTLEHSDDYDHYSWDFEGHEVTCLNVGQRVVGNYNSRSGVGSFA